VSLDVTVWSRLSESTPDLQVWKWGWPVISLAASHRLRDTGGGSASPSDDNADRAAPPLGQRPVHLKYLVDVSGEGRPQSALFPAREMQPIFEP
jgi:hypothetical protein